MGESSPDHAREPTELIRRWADGMFAVTQRTDGEKSWFSVRSGLSIDRPLENHPETTTVLLPGETVVVHSDGLGEQLAVNHDGDLELRPYSLPAVQQLESQGFTVLFMDGQY